MPFITLEFFKSLRPEIASVSKADDKFENLEAAMSILVTDKTGIPIPIDADDTPDWIKIPAVDILSYFFIENNYEADIETKQYYKAGYNQALKELANHSVKGVSTRINSFEIAEKYVW